jgi:membrane protein DedA with SNARE-associated domain
VTHTLVGLIDSYGLVAIFVLMLAESCGVPFPSEVIMPVGGLLALAGHLNLAAVILVGTAGNLAGSLIAYGLAARFGTPLLLGPGRWIGISSGHLLLAQRWFQRRGQWAVLVGRVLPVVRTYVSFPAGLAGVPLAAFSGLTALGALPWCTLLAVAGFLLGSEYGRVASPIERAAEVLAALVVLAVVAWYLRGRSRGEVRDERLSRRRP